jgi:hypothetical protein
MVTALFFVCGVLALLLALYMSMLHRFANDAFSFLATMTRKMGPGVVHEHRPGRPWVAIVTTLLGLTMVGVGVYRLIA